MLVGKNRVESHGASANLIRAELLYLGRIRQARHVEDDGAESPSGPTAETALIRRSIAIAYLK